MYNRRAPPPATFAPKDGHEANGRSAEQEEEEGEGEGPARLPGAASEAEFIEGASAMSMDAALEAMSTPEKKKKIQLVRAFNMSFLVL